MEQVEYRYYLQEKVKYKKGGKVCSGCGQQECEC